jgi:hypothetical protein
VPDVELTGVTIVDRDGQRVDRLATGQPFSIRLGFRAPRRVEDAVFEVLIYSIEGRLHCQFSTAADGNPLPALEGSGYVEIACDELALMPGIFTLDAAVLRRGSPEPYDRWPQACVLRVVPGKHVRGLFYAPHRWRLERVDTSLGE